MDTLHQAGYLKIGLVGEETAKRNKNDARLLFTTGHFFSLMLAAAHAMHFCGDVARLLTCR